MAKILLSIYPEYTNAIFSGIKTAEFRRKVVNELLEGGSHTLSIRAQKTPSDEITIFLVM